MREFLLNLLRWALYPQLYFFSRSLGDPQKMQRRFLSKVCQSLSRTEYGKELKVTANESYETFSSKVPIVSYEEVAGLIDKQMTSSSNTLTASKIHMFERTSGSSGPVKYIPYTKQLIKSFTRMFLLWCADVLMYGPRFSAGKVFMSVSPSIGGSSISKGGRQIGSNDDLDYVSGWISPLLRRIMVVPANIQKINDGKTFKHVLSAYLLSAADLEMVSVWNPSYFEVLLEFITENRFEVQKTLQEGELQYGSTIFRFKPLSLEREKLLAAPNIDWSLLWPNLKFISCWASANARVSSGRLQELFPHALIQGKGLLATEAPLTIPLTQFGQFVPLIDQVFYEFESDDGEILPLWEVKGGKSYALIISQLGGLCRYRLGDSVVVTGFAHNTACFEFIGRSACSDLVGEKLHEDFVAKVLDAPSFCNLGVNILMPVQPVRGKAHYLLVCERLDGEPGQLAKLLDDALYSSFHYKHARVMGQLGELEVRVEEDISPKYIAAMQSKGMHLGNIKTPLLITRVLDAKKLIEYLDTSVSVPDRLHTYLARIT